VLVTAYRIGRVRDIAAVYRLRIVHFVHLSWPARASP
jgi:hypothetical protein